MGKPILVARLDADHLGSVEMNVYFWPYFACRASFANGCFLEAGRFALVW